MFAAALVIFHLIVIVEDPAGQHVVDLGPFPSKAYCEVDRAKVIEKLRPTAGRVAPTARVVSTGCISLEAKTA